MKNVTDKMPSSTKDTAKINNPANRAKPSFAVVGCGKVGTSLARHLSRAGYPAAATVSRSAVSAERAARLSGAPRYGTEPAQYTAEAGMVLITTPDGAIEETWSYFSAAVLFLRRSWRRLGRPALLSALFIPCRVLLRYRPNEIPFRRSSLPWKEMHKRLSRQKPRPVIWAVEAFG